MVRWEQKPQPSLVRTCLAILGHITEETQTSPASLGRFGKLNLVYCVSRGRLGLLPSDLLPSSLLPSKLLPPTSYPPALP